MKSRIMILLLLLIGFCPGSQAQKSKFFIASHLVGSGDLQHLEGMVSYFTTQFRSKLTERYPCAKVKTDEEIKKTIQTEREKSLGGSESARGLTDIGRDLECDYLINLEIGTLIGEKFIVSASCIPYRTKFPTMHFSSVSNDSPGSGQQKKNNCDEVADKIVDGLKNTEICPYRGSILVEIKTERDDHAVDTYPVYCNGRDGIYKKESKDHKSSETIWTLTKKNSYSVGGTIACDITETSEMEEQNDCYTCSSGRKGGRTYSEKSRSSVKIQGLSNESTAENQHVEDARAEIKFLEDGTYTLRVKAASKWGDLQRTKDIHAEGSCDNLNTPPERTVKKADIGLNEIFGPFTGTSIDKELSQKQTITKIDPVSKEHTTISFDFNLKRD